MSEYTWDEFSKDIDADRAQRTKEQFQSYALGLQSGKQDPREYYRRDNKATWAVADLWERWTGIPAGQHNQYKCVAKLLSEVEDVDLIEEAVREASNRGKIYHGIDMYYMRKIIENQVDYLKNNKVDWTSYAQQELDDDVEEPEWVTCPECGKQILPHALGMSCAGH